MADASVGSRLLDPTEVRLLAGRIGLRPTKVRGQNFVVDPGTIRRIVRASGVGAGDVVLEVGPGLGSLTLGLLPAVQHLVAVEVDAALAGALPDTVRTHAEAYVSRLTVLHADALSLTPADLPEAHAPTALVANLPYNVAVPVFLHLLQVLPGLREGLVLVQAEVAGRLAAPPGGRLYGVPSVKAAWFADVWRVGVVGRNVFWPRPNVESALVGWRRRPPPPTTACRRDVFAVVDAAFQQRRKTLRAALARWAGGVDPAERMLRDAGIDPQARGETLDVSAFARLAEQRAAPSEPYDAAPW